MTERARLETLCAERHPAVQGPEGRIETLLECARPLRPGAPLAVICHPHSLHGGSLHNKVAHMVARALRQLGAHAVRFNFRGVGGSAGRFDHGRGEVEDLAAVVAWGRARFPGSPLWLAGFSFGAAMAFAGAARLGAQRLLLVAPPVHHPYFPHAEMPDIPSLVVMGGEDEVVGPTSVSRWVSAQPHAPTYLYLDTASHFFHGQLVRLRDDIVAVWGGAI
jgi:alpha/beta superfamily hydrolase